MRVRALIAIATLASCDAPSEPVPQATLVIQAAADSLVENGLLRLRAVFQGAAGAPPADSLTWSSSDTTVLTVDARGLVSGRYAGSALVTARYADMDSAVIRVRVLPARVARVIVSPDTLSLPPGLSTSLSADALDSAGIPLRRTIAWTSRDSAIASVSQDGVVTGVATGTTTINAAIEGVAGQAVIRVVSPRVRLVVRGTVDSVVENGLLRLHAVLEGSASVPSADSLRWSSSDTSVLVVDSSGLVTARYPGSAVVTVRRLNSDSASTRIRVVAARVARVTISPDPINLPPGLSTELSAQAIDSANSPLRREVTWSSSDPAIVSVTPTGVATGVANGTATIRASVGAVAGEAVARVAAFQVASVRVTPSSASLELGESIELQARAFDASGQQIHGITFAWRVFGNPVIELNERGVAKGARLGINTVYAQAGGRQDTSMLSVHTHIDGSLVSAPSEKVLYREDTVRMVAGFRRGGLLEPAPGTVWSVADTNIVVHVGGGLMRARAQGTTQVTARASRRMRSSTLTVRAASEGVSIDSGARRVLVGQSLILAADARTAQSGATVAWSTSRPDLVRLTALDGNRVQVSGAAPGSADITARASTFSASTSVSVLPKEVASLSGSWDLRRLDQEDYPFTRFNNNSSTSGSGSLSFNSAGRFDIEIRRYSESTCSATSHGGTAEIRGDTLILTATTRTYEVTCQMLFPAGAINPPVVYRGMVDANELTLTSSSNSVLYFRRR